jgi:hypothetical protein
VSRRRPTTILGRFASFMRKTAFRVPSNSSTTCAKLAIFPKRGRPRPGYGARVRSFPVPPVVFFYSVASNPTRCATQLRNCKHNGSALLINQKARSARGSPLLGQLSAHTADKNRDRWQLTSDARRRVGGCNGHRRIRRSRDWRKTRMTSAIRARPGQKRSSRHTRPRLHPPASHQRDRKKPL